MYTLKINAPQLCNDIGDAPSDTILVGQCNEYTFLFIVREVECNADDNIFIEHIVEVFDTDSTYIYSPSYHLFDKKDFKWFTPKNVTISVEV